MEVMLLEDYENGKMPQSIQNIIGYLENCTSPPSQNDLIVGFIYILMLEAGFVPLEAEVCDETCDFSYSRLLQQTTKLIGLRKSETTFHLEFILLRSMPHVCNLNCLLSGDDMIVNCLVKGAAAFTLILDPLGYFTGSKKRPFQNLDQLSRKFKTTISYPAKVEILRSFNLYYPSLEWLVPEIQNQIMTYLDIDSVINLAKTCSTLCLSTNCVALWIRLLNIDFRKRKIHKTVDELENLYKTLYEPKLTKILLEGPNNVVFSNEELIRNSRLS